MEANFAVEVTTLAATLRQFYYDKETAEAEVAKIVPLLGIPSYSHKRNDESSLTHVLAGPMGDLTVVIDKVESIRVIDVSKWEEEVTLPFEKIRNERDLEKTRQLLELKKAYGFTS